MKTIRLILAAALLIAAPALGWAAGGGVTHVRAIMIVASAEKGKSDPMLGPYEANLRRILRFESYRVVAEGAVEVALARGSPVLLNLTRGHRLELSREGQAVHATWFDGSRKVVTLALPPGKPSILGGPAWGDRGEVCAVIVIPE
jgi:hypothetical protein